MTNAAFLDFMVVFVCQSIVQGSVAHTLNVGGVMVAGVDLGGDGGEILIDPLIGGLRRGEGTGEGGRGSGVGRRGMKEQ